LARRLATAGLQLSEVMMTHTQIIQRYTRVSLLFSAAYQQIFFSPTVTALRRGNGLGITILFSAAHQQICFSPAATA
jgi:hypothetical protein